MEQKSTLETTETAGSAPATETRAPMELKDRVVEILRTVYDPEIPVNIYELGMIYDIAVDDAGAVNIKMTLTSPMCPVAGSLPGEVEQKVAKVPGVSSAKIELVWEPPWAPDKMSDVARFQLGMF